MIDSCFWWALWTPSSMVAQQKTIEQMNMLDLFRRCFHSWDFCLRKDPFSGLTRSCLYVYLENLEMCLHKTTHVYMLT